MFLAVAVRGKAHRDRAAIAHGAARLLEQFAHQTHAVLERAAVFVGAAVQAAREEFRDQVAVGRIDVDDVEAGLARTQRRFAVPALELANVAPVHALRLHRGRCAMASSARRTRAGGSTGSRHSCRRARARCRRARRAHAPRRPSPRDCRGRRHPKARRTGRDDHPSSDESSSTRCTRPPSRPPLSLRASRPASAAARGPCPCNEAPDIIGSAR